MAGNQLKLRVPASSILEVIVSMVVILLVFGIAMMISANVFRASLSAKKMRAQAILQSVLIDAEHNKNYTTGNLTIDSFRVEQIITPLEGNPRLLKIHLTAYDRNREKVTELEKLIINRNEQPSR